MPSRPWPPLPEPDLYAPSQGAAGPRPSSGCAGTATTGGPGTATTGGFGAPPLASGHVTDASRGPPAGRRPAPGVPPSLPQCPPGRVSRRAAGAQVERDVPGQRAEEVGCVEDLAGRGDAGRLDLSRQ